ncbi:MAG: hypothetical protein GC205_09455 [Bacteroidetes bacterium]|nr:hypothetical protein [Bacteroidota bacterium]
MARFSSLVAILLVVCAAVPIKAQWTNTDSSLGIGMAAPRFFDFPVMGFYTGPYPEKSIQELSPFDSLVFKRTEWGCEISYAPPWFFPAHAKLDYDMLYLKVLSISNDMVLVETNKLTGQSSWLARDQVQVFFWPEFLLRTHSVEAKNNRKADLRIKGLDHASAVNTTYTMLHPVQVQEYWMQVQLLNADLQILDYAWLKWRDAAGLLIDYSLLD